MYPMAGNVTLHTVYLAGSLDLAGGSGSVIVVYCVLTIEISPKGVLSLTQVQKK